MKEKTLSIAFYKGTSRHAWSAFKQRIIRLWTNGPYAHVEVITHLTGEDPRDGTWHAATAYHPGATVSRKLEIKEKNWDIYGLDVTPHQAQMCLDWIRNHDGLKYDWLGLWLNFGLGIKRHMKSQFFCSEYVAAALDNNVLACCPLLPCQYSPNSLFKRLSKFDQLTKI